MTKKERKLTKKDIFETEYDKDKVVLVEDVLSALALAKKKFWEFEKRRAIGKKWNTSPDKILDDCFKIGEDKEGKQR